MKPLNESQRAVATHPAEGILLVEALAGSGKSTTLRQRVPYLLRARDSEKGFGSAPGGNALFAMLQQAETSAAGKVLVLAYGRAIADELAAHFKNDLSADDCRRVAATTCHGQALSMVYKFRMHTPVPAGVKIDLVPNWKLLQALADLPDIEAAKFKKAALSGLLNLEAIANARGVDLETAWPRLRQEVKKNISESGLTPEEAMTWVPKLRAHRMRLGLITHDDTIPLVNQMPLSVFKSLGFTDIIVDELQDLNYQQRQLVFKLMADAKSFTGCGDSRQCIATFQGSDPRIFDQMREQYQGRTVTTRYLTNNYRCSEPILHVANQVLAKELACEHQLVGTGATGPAVEVHTNGADSLIECLHQREASGEAWKDMAVLYRFHAHAPELELALAASGIPYVLTGASFFELPEVQDMICYLELLYRPKPEYAYWRRIIDHVQGLGSYAAERAWEDLGNPLTDCSRVPKGISRPEMRQAWAGYQSRARSIQDVAGRPCDVVYRLKELLTSYWGERYGDNPDKLADKLDLVDAFVTWVENFGGYATGLDVLLAIDAYEKGNRQKDPDADGVRLGTLHGAKGREWPSVIIYNVGDGSFPGRANTDEERATEWRLVYVGLTRAKRYLALVCKDAATAATSSVARYVPNYAATVQSMLEFGAGSEQDFDHYLDLDAA